MSSPMTRDKLMKVIAGGISKAAQAIVVSALVLLYIATRPTRWLSDAAAVAANTVDAAARFMARPFLKRLK